MSFTLNSCTPPCDPLPYTERRHEHAGRPKKTTLRPVVPKDKKDHNKVHKKIVYVALFLLFLFYLKKTNK